MSHFVEVKTEYKDQKCLALALKEIFGNVEVCEQPKALIGWHGDDRSKLVSDNPNYAPACHLIVRRKFIGSASNDIGFRHSGDGKWSAYISAFDKTDNSVRIGQIAQQYAKQVTIKTAKIKGYSVQEEKLKDGQVKLTLSKWGQS